MKVIYILKFVTTNANQTCAVLARILLKQIQFLTEKILELLVKGNSYTKKLYYKTSKRSIPLLILI